MKKNDPIVDEVHAVREGYAAQFRHDLQAIFRDLHAKQSMSGRKYEQHRARPTSNGIGSNKYSLGKTVTNSSTSNSNSTPVPTWSPRQSIAWRIGGWVCLFVATVALCVSFPMLLREEMRYTPGIKWDEVPLWSLPAWWLNYNSSAIVAATALLFAFAMWIFFWTASGRRASILWGFYVALSLVVGLARPIAMYSLWSRIGNDEYGSLVLLALPLIYAGVLVFWSRRKRHLRPDIVSSDDTIC